VNVVDLFAGMGGIKLGFERNGFKAVFSNDIDANCKKTFDSNFTNSLQKEGLTLKSITEVSSDSLPGFDLLTGGFTDEERGDLFFEIIRILRDKKPRAFLLENVKNLKIHDKGNTLALIYKELESIGHFVKDVVLNTLDYGNLPQNRERIYIVGFLSKKEAKKFVFPEKIKLTKTIQDCLIKGKVANKYYYNGKPLYEKIKDDVTKYGTVYQWRRKYVRENKSNACPTLTANMGTGGHNVPIIKDEFGIRKLMPRECANFQGFPQDYQLPNIADSQLYKQLGNSVSVPVIERIAYEMKRVLYA